MLSLVPWSISRRTIALVLLAAVALKAYAVAATPLLGPTLFQGREWQLLIIWCESTWIAWLLTGSGGQVTWALAGGMLLLFAGVNSFQWAIGAPSCGCFGPMKIAPAYSLGLDLGALGLVLVSRPSI